MSLTAFVSTRAVQVRRQLGEARRHQHIVDSSYMSTRADHTKYIKRSGIGKGPSAERKSKRAEGIVVSVGMQHQQVETVSHGAADTARQPAPPTTDTDTAAARMWMPRLTLPLYRWRVSGR
jgi:hypothetical protein